MRGSDDPGQARRVLDRRGLSNRLPCFRIMAKANPSASATPLPARTISPTPSTAKSKQKPAVKNKASANGGKPAAPAKKGAAQHAATAAPRVQAEAHETQEKIRELI